MIDPRRLLRSVLARCERVMGSLRVLMAPGVSAGKQVVAGRGCRLIVTDGGTCVLGDSTYLARNVEITIKRGELRVGRGCFIGLGSVVTAKESVTIEDGCFIAEYVTIRDSDHRMGIKGTVASRGFEVSPIHIGKNVWIGAKATITRGVSIGENSVVAAGAVVTRSIPPNTLVAGVPARFVKEISD